MDHGVEYMVKKKDGTCIRVATMQQTRDRLLRSTYYEANRDHFQAYHRFPFRNRIEVDMELTPSERELLEKIENTHEDIESHGWYEVCTDTTCTY